MQKKFSSQAHIAIYVIAACAISTGAAAHTGIEVHAQLSFWSGFAHPWTGLDHLAAMLAVGLWSALTARSKGPGLLWGPLGFAAMLLAGAVLGLQGIAVAAVEPMIATSLGVMGLLVASRLQVAGVVAALLVGVFGAFHGLAHGYELAGQPDAVQTLAGMLSATLLLHATGLGLGWALRSASVWAPRVVGTAVAALGVATAVQLA